MGLLDDMLEGFLKQSIFERWSDSFHPLEWKNNLFSSYTNNELLLRDVLQQAVEKASIQLKVPFGKIESSGFNSKIVLNLTPRQVLPLIALSLNQTMRRGMKCPAGTNPTLKAVRQPDGSVVYEWVCE